MINFYKVSSNRYSAKFPSVFFLIFFASYYKLATRCEVYLVFIILHLKFLNVTDY